MPTDEWPCRRGAGALCASLQRVGSFLLSSHPRPRSCRRVSSRAHSLAPPLPSDRELSSGRQSHFCRTKSSGLQKKRLVLRRKSIGPNNVSDHHSWQSLESFLHSAPAVPSWRQRVAPQYSSPAQVGPEMEASKQDECLGSMEEARNRGFGAPGRPVSRKGQVCLILPIVSPSLSRHLLCT